jgi:hypothetical protein
MTERIDAQFPILAEPYNGHDIYLRSDFRFEVAGPHFNDLKPRERIFEALSDAKAKVKELEEDHQKEIALKTKLHLSIVTDLGGIQIVDKISRSNSRIVGIPDNVKSVYPNVPHVVEAVRRRNQLRDEVEAISKILLPLEIAAGRGWTRERIAVEELPEYNKKLADEYAAKLKLAKEGVEPIPHANLKVVE